MSMPIKATKNMTHPQNSETNSNRSKIMHEVIIYFANKQTRHTDANILYCCKLFTPENDRHKMIMQHQNLYHNINSKKYKLAEKYKLNNLLQYRRHKCEPSLQLISFKKA